MVCLTVSLAMGPLRTAHPQPLSMPSAHHTEHRLAVSASAWRAELMPSRGQWFALQGPVVKGSFAPLQAFNLFVFGGAADWVHGTTPTGYTWWSKGYTPLVGLGTWIEPFERGPVRPFLGAQLAVHWGEGAFYRRDTRSGVLRIVRWDEVKQTTGMGSSCGGLGVEGGPLRLYFGIAARKWARLYRTQSQILESGHWQRNPAIEHEQCWGVQYGPFLAVELKLPGRFFLSVEGARWAAHSYTASIGLGQIGPP